MKVGKNSDDPRLSHDFRVRAAAELARMRKGRSAINDLCERPHRYPALVDLLAYLSPGWRHLDVVRRQAQVSAYFNTALDRLNDDRLAASLKVWIGLEGSPRSELNARRVAALKIWDPAGSSAPDTIYRTYERGIWDEALLDAVVAVFDIDVSVILPKPAADSVNLADWEDDLYLTHLAVVRNDPFKVAELERNLRRYLAAVPSGLETVQLAATTFRLLADSRRDSGRLSGPDGAASLYQNALNREVALGSERRQAEISLMLAVVMELQQRNERANVLYRRLAGDERLRPLQRAKAQLWIATTDTKLGNSASAVALSRTAVDKMKEYGTENDVYNAEQKLALALKADGKLDSAVTLIMDLEHPTADPTPIEQVRLEVARSDILFATGSVDAEQLTRLERVAFLAHSRQMTTQIRYINKVMKRIERQKA